MTLAMRPPTMIMKTVVSNIFLLPQFFIQRDDVIAIAHKHLAFFIAEPILGSRYQEMENAFGLVAVRVIMDEMRHPYRTV